MKFPFPDLRTKRTTLRILQPDDAECDPANEKSIALLEKFGFRLAGTLENHQKRYHLSKAEWDTHSTR